MLSCCKTFLGREATWGTSITDSVPVNSALPVASNSGGDLLTTTNGTWSNDPNLFTYQWFKNGVLLAGKTTKTYQAIAVGTYKVRVKGININGIGAGVFSNDIVI